MSPAGGGNSVLHAVNAIESNRAIAAAVASPQNCKTSLAGGGATAALSTTTPRTSACCGVTRTTPTADHHLPCKLLRIQLKTTKTSKTHTSPGLVWSGLS